MKQCLQDMVDVIANELDPTACAPTIHIIHRKNHFEIASGTYYA